MIQEPKIIKRYFYSDNLHNSYPRCKLLTTNFDNIPDVFIGETIYVDDKYYSVENIIKGKNAINYILRKTKTYTLII